MSSTTRNRAADRPNLNTKKANLCECYTLVVLPGGSLGSTLNYRLKGHKFKTKAGHFGASIAEQYKFLMWD